MTEVTVRNLTPTQAWKLVENNPSALLIDVRSHMEFLFVGHPKKAIHVSWIDQPDWDVNPDFADEVHKALLGSLEKTVRNSDQVPIILICRSGKRSLEAGKALINQGFRAVYNVQDGFEGDLDETHRRSTRNGWRFHGLPWEQS